jgi:hypothetical protein
MFLFSFRDLLMKNQISFHEFRYQQKEKQKSWFLQKPFLNGTKITPGIFPGEKPVTLI